MIADAQMVSSSPALQRGVASAIAVVIATLAFNFIGFAK
jgi:hypothetical protein